MAEKILQFKITLMETTPSVTRKLHIPSDYNFFQLHMAIQAAFGWNDYHLFQFCEKNIMDSTSISIPSDEDKYDDKAVHDARSILITSIFTKPKSRYSYIYDFGDDWLHEIVLEKSIKEPIYTPFCIEAKNACPPEDVGGIGGYSEMLKVFKGKASEEKENYNAWIGLEPGENWRADYCNRREVNNRLALLGYWSYEASVRFMPKDWYKSVK